jgi:hypothetical protein
MVWERESEGQLVVNFLRHNTYKVQGRIGFVSVLQRRNHQRFWLDSAEWQLAWDSAMGSTQSSGAIHDHGYARGIRVIDKTCFSSAVNLMNIVNVAEHF